MKSAFALAVLLGATTSGPAALRSVADDLAAQAAAAADPARTILAVRVDGPAPLAAALAAAMEQALRSRGYRGVVGEATDADARLSVKVGIEAGELQAAGQLSGTRLNFFTGQPAVGSAAVAARAAADASTRLLAGSAPAGPGALRVRPWGELPEPPLALAAGDLDGPAVAALTSAAVYVFRGGTRLRWALPDPAPDAVPALDPAGGVVIADGAVLWALPAIGRAGALQLSSGALVASGEHPPSRVPLAAGRAGVLAARAQAGRNTFEPALLLSAHPDDPAPRAGAAPGPVLAAVPGRGTTAFLVRTTSALVPLTSELAAAGPGLEGVGAGFAMADLLGDGKPLLVVTGAGASLPDRVRVLPPGGGPPLLDWPGIPAVLTAAAAADLDGDSREDVILGGAGPGAGGVLYEVHAP